MFIKSTEKADTQGSTLILPCVSIGNVPQLAADLLINTLEATRIGIIHTDTLLPISSSTSGFDHSKQQLVPAEIYQSKDSRWTILQQRAPPLPKRQKRWAQELKEFIELAGFHKVVLLTSSDAALRADKLIDNESNIWTLTVNCKSELVGGMQSLALSPSDGQNGVESLHSAGVAKPLLRLCQDMQLPVVVLAALVYEGDNVPDAINLANATNRMLDILPATQQWRAPMSWQWLMAPSNVPAQLF
ncbi:hypothetical protein H4R22_002991 [Coemansia sp. RSA 1290]|nr:hypothetical protein LPJ68_004114 [Coemansia sp. RSA 1086]KAJ1748513.1 hypothetical protein LPJ79_004469 [Coemansia sp. RSA 1821]KAJ1870510.1 hypothetical protein LPJ55_004615 [Coemansia sp. RSA 990]KAJ2629986.1 hypothetical protein H4R22_002991 [Coemansia sp. RSA 1290]KAJ2653598.1 hypothetical protein IWW40_000292 [Coemansia sp. RSA 1250]KAJ2677310.1 hypothetical protein IWW42_000116 [Coemansia sp. RSA 1085]